MAIDLGTNSTPYEFENMLPLDVLAAVASETLRNEIHTDDISDKMVESSLKRQIKKSNLTVMTFEDIKALPVKSLVDKFSELTSDELTKKYFYKCLLLPHKCTTTFKSFGNEKKACDKIKSHLLSHVQQIAVEYDSNEEISTTIYIPRSPASTSKHSEKLSKKPRKHQVLLSPGLTHKAHKSSKKKGSVYCLKKMKKFQNLNKKSMNEFKKSLKDKKLFNSVYLKEKSSSKRNTIKGLSYKSIDENIFSPKIKEDHLEDSDVESDRGRYNSYSEHLKSTFLSDAFLDDDNESLVYCEEVPSMNDGVCEEENVSEQTVIASNDRCLIFLQDHNYAMSDEGSKSEKLLSQESKHFSRRNITCFTHQPTVQPQLIIRTPPFPFVHTPLLPEVAEIKEIGLGEMCHSSKVDHSNCFDYLCDESKIKHEVEDVHSDEQLSEPEEKYAASIFYKMTGASGSVLECVENIVNNKYSSSCIPKSEITANENDENLENLQRIEKELALKYIAKLHAKKKKRIPDSLICQICPDKHFTAQATLIHHYRSHAGIKPYVCKICSATFTRQHSLNYHMLIHQNLSRFTCEFCGRTFRHPSHYKEHLRRHTGETPYHCTDCNLHFKTRNTFKRHLKTRHGKLLTASGIEDLSVEDYAKFSPKSKFGK